MKLLFYYYFLNKKNYILEFIYFIYKYKLNKQKYYLKYFTHLKVIY